MKGKAPDLMKDVQKITATITLNNETLEESPHNQEKCKDIQYNPFCFIQGFSQHSKTKGKYKIYEGWKGKNNLAIN